MKKFIAFGLVTVILSGCSSSTETLPQNIDVPQQDKTSIQIPEQTPPPVVTEIPKVEVKEPSVPAPQPAAEQVQNLENIVPQAVNIDDKAFLKSLQDDPSLKSSPITEAPKAGVLSGEAEASIISAGGADFEIDHQLHDDILSANDLIALPHDSKDLDDAYEISKSMGLDDINNLSIPEEEISLSSDTSK